MLNVHGALRREKFLVSVDMRLEAHPLFRDLAQRRQRHHLKAAAVGKNRVWPVHEFVQAAQPRDPFCARAQHQMIGIAQNDVGPGLAYALRQHGLDAARRTNRHESRRANVATRRTDDASARRAVPCRNFQAEAAHGGLISRQASP